MAHRKLLVISPSFHGYGNAAAHGFGAIGHDTEVFHYDEFATIPAKVRNKAQFELADRLRPSAAGQAMARWATERAAQKVRSTNATHVLVIRGDILQEEFWDALSRQSLPTVLWLYDELGHMRFERANLFRPRAIVSYSPPDVELLSSWGLPAHFVADAFDSFTTFKATPSDSIVFVGARYPSRERVMTDLVAANIPVHAYGRDWSHHPFDRLRTWDLSRPDVPWSRDIDRRSAYAVMGGAIAALNIHEDQSGFTMRTFEIPGAGGLQFIDRTDIGSIYEPDSEVLVFTSREELIELCNRARMDRPWRDRIAEAGHRRTLAEHTFVHRARQIDPLWD
jgi:spore maturation protein CgeB